MAPWLQEQGYLSNELGKGSTERKEAAGSEAQLRGKLHRCGLGKAGGGVLNRAQEDSLLSLPPAKEK